MKINDTLDYNDAFNEWKRLRDALRAIDYALRDVSDIIDGDLAVDLLREIETAKRDREQDMYEYENQPRGSEDWAMRTAGVW